MSWHADYWTRTLAGLSAELALPWDRPRPEQPSHAGALLRRELDDEVLDRLTRLARGRGATLFMAVQAGLAAYLTHVTGDADVPLGAVVTGRPNELLDGLIGFFANTVVLRTDVSGNPSFTGLLDRVRDLDLSAFEHQDMPFDMLVDHIRPPRAPGRNPLFQVALAFEDTSSGLSLAGVDATPHGVHIDVAKFDLTFSFTVGPDRLAVELTYATDLFDNSTACSLLTGLTDALTRFAAAPDLPVLRQGNPALP